METNKAVRVVVNNFLLTLNVFELKHIKTTFLLLQLLEIVVLNVVTAQNHNEVYKSLILLITDIHLAAMLFKKYIKQTPYCTLK